MPAAWVLLPATGVFVLPVADPRAALSSVTLRWDDHFKVDAAIAENFPLLALTLGELHADLGIEAGVWMGFDPEDNLRFDLVTVDGTFGIPLAVQSGPWSGRLELAHTSAHFADGVRGGATLPGSPDGYSREWLSVIGSRQLGPARLYVGGHALIHDQRGAPPFGVQLGGEVEGPWRVAPYAAVDLQVADEFAWTPAVAGQAGVRLVFRDGQRLRVAVAGHHGPDDTGKLVGNDDWLGVSFGFDVNGRVTIPGGVNPP